MHSSKRIGEKRWMRRKRSNSELATIGYEMMRWENGHRKTWERKEKEGGGKKRRGWNVEDSLAYATMVHWVFPALPFHLALFSLLLFSRNIWVGGREKEKVTVSWWWRSEGEGVTEGVDDYWEGLKTFSTTKQVCNINQTIITKHTQGFPQRLKE